MLDGYATAIDAGIRGCVAVTAYSLNTAQLSPSTGYVEAEVMFLDGSRLILFEFLRWTATGWDREKYRYHVLDPRHQLLFRYDNAHHHPGVATFPHHKHLPREVTDSLAPRFTDVLAEVETHVLRVP